MLANFKVAPSRSMSWLSESLTSRNSRRVASISLLNFSIVSRSLSDRMMLPPSPFCWMPSSFSWASLRLGLQPLLLLAELLFRVPLDLVDHRERPRLHAPPAQIAQRFSARQVLERIDHEHGIVRERDLDLLAEEIALIEPELVVQEVGIGDHDGVELACR